MATPFFYPNKQSTCYAGALLVDLPFTNCIG